MLGNVAIHLQPGRFKIEQKVHIADVRDEITVAANIMAPYNIR